MCTCSVCLEEGEEEVCNVFDTVDRGIVFVDDLNWKGVENWNSLLYSILGESISQETCFMEA